MFVDGEVVQTLFGMRSSDDLYYTIKNYIKEEENYEDVWATLFDADEAEKEDQDDKEQELEEKKKN